MKTPLDDTKNLSQLDSLSVQDTISLLGQQFESGWHDSQFLSLNFEFENIKNVVFVGMGGSNLPAHIINSLSPLILLSPFEIVSNYRLPKYVDKNTLVILTSYSGNTEEVLSCAQDSKKRNAKTIAITTGGKLKETALTEHWPLLLLDGKLNRSHVPRFGLGLLLGATMGLLVRQNPEAYSFVDPKNIVKTLESSLNSLSPNIPSTNNPAKSFAIKNKGQAIIIFSANHLTGVAKTAANFINETAKTFSTSFTVPDLNHHLLDGLTFPTSFKDSTRFIILNSSLYPEIIQKRLQITKDLLIKQKYQLTVIKPESTEIVSQVFESLVFLIMISYYLSIVNQQDPGTNRSVDYFKNQLN